MLMGVIGFMIDGFTATTGTTPRQDWLGLCRFNEFLAMALAGFSFFRLLLIWGFFVRRIRRRWLVGVG
jgi:hypothetical protein